jgi:hypothetical protein
LRLTDATSSGIKGASFCRERSELDAAFLSLFFRVVWLGVDDSTKGSFRSRFSRDFWALCTASDTLIYAGLESSDTGAVRAFEGLEEGSNSSGIVRFSCSFSGLKRFQKIKIYVLG